MHSRPTFQKFRIDVLSNNRFMSARYTFSITETHYVSNTKHFGLFLNHILLPDAVVVSVSFSN